MIRRSIGAAAFLVAFIATPVYAYTSPGVPTGHVNDFAGVMSTEAKQSLEAELSAFAATSSNEIAVAVVPDLGGDYIENYAVRLFEEWGVGNAQNDNGVLLLIAVEERELRIEVGYGLEGALPDTVAASILTQDIVPHLRDGDYDGAVRSGVEKIMEATRGEYAPEKTAMPLSFQSIFDNIWLVFFGGIFALQWLAAILGRSKPWWPGGVLGAIAGLGLGWFFALATATILGIIGVLTVLGLVFDYAVSNAYRSAMRSGSSPAWWAGGSGRSARSGGFGGFGGGMSGGGGASGRW